MPNYLSAVFYYHGTRLVPIMPNYLSECGVFYYHGTRLDDHDWRFWYSRLHIETNILSEHDIFIYGGYPAQQAELGFYKLLDHWNKNEQWRYSSILHTHNGWR